MFIIVKSFSHHKYAPYELNPCYRIPVKCYMIHTFEGESGINDTKSVCHERFSTRECKYDVVFRSSLKLYQRVQKQRCVLPNRSDILQRNAGFMQFELLEIARRQSGDFLELIGEMGNAAIIQFV